MNLGEPARKASKGNSLDYYLDALYQARERSLAECRQRDDKWLATLVTEGDFSANNYAKWFHVAEHESNHDGQIKFLKSRVPGTKSTPKRGSWSSYVWGPCGSVLTPALLFSLMSRMAVMKRLVLYEREFQ